MSHLECSEPPAVGGIMNKISWLGVVFCAVLVAAFLPSGVPANAAGISSPIPLKAAAIIDEASTQGSTNSTLFKNVARVMSMNKLSMDTLDVSGDAHYTFVDASGNPKYSVVIILASGSRIDQINSQALLTAVNKGSGAVAVWPDAVNSYLNTAFGISVIGTLTGYEGASFRMEQDKFTFSYAGQIVEQPAQYKNHTLAAGSEMVATFSSSAQPALWVSAFGSGKTVFHNTTATQTLSYQGILLQSILYAMPIGVSSPANVAGFEVDDCPTPYYSDEMLQSYYYEFLTNLFRFEEAYNLRTSHFVAFSYNWNSDDFWSYYPESEHGAADILANGNELGLHTGTNHVGLTLENWGSEAAINAEAEAISAALARLRNSLAQDYGVNMNTVTSYVAPSHAIDSYGYAALDQLTNLKYVGTGFDWKGGTSASLNNAYVADSARVYLQSIAAVEKEKSNLSETFAAPAATGPEISPEVLKDFGWEPGTAIYNLPRIQGDVSLFIQEDNPYHQSAWDLLRSMLESGQPYLIFTHSDEVDEVKVPGWTWGDVYRAYTTFADFAVDQYPFYRWQTVTQIGDMLSTRTGTIDGIWQAPTNTLTLTVPQPEDPVHVKTALHLAGITQSGNVYTLTFSQTDTGFVSASHDVVHKGQDYFIYPLASQQYRLTKPATTFAYEEVGLNRAPALSPIGSKVTYVGQTLNFTVDATDPNGDSLTYSASNLPAGASFNAATRTFTWTPAAAGTQSSVCFRVSDGVLSDFENIMVTAVASDGQYGLSASISGEGSVVKNPDRTSYSAGTSVQLTATAALGYVFSGWSGDLVSLANPATVVMNSDKTITATFSVVSQSAVDILKSINVSGDDGFSGPWGYYNSLGWYEAGSPGLAYNAWFRFTGITIPAGSVIEEAHLELSQAAWGSGTSLIIRAEDSASPTAPTNAADHAGKVRTTAGAAWPTGYADRTYHNSPNFAPVIQELLASYSYSAGTLQILVDNSGSSNAEHVGFTYDSGSAPRLYVRYRPASAVPKYSLTVGTVGSGNVARSPEQTAYDHGTTVQMTAIPAAGWVFSSWSGSSRLTSTTANPTTIVMNANETVTATFTQQVQYTLTTSVVGQGTVTNNPVQATYTQGTQVQLTAIPATGWALSSWSGSPNLTSTTTNPTTIVMNANETVTATYTQQTQYTLTANVVGQGTVTNNPVQATYTQGTQVQLTAIPATGWALSLWSGSLNLTSTTTNPTTIVMNANETVTANFVQSQSTEITRTVAIGTDDGFSGTWGYYNGLAWYEAGNPGSSYNAWYRFTGTSIPKGATILHAYLQTSQASWKSGTNLKISAEKAVSPAAPTSLVDHSAPARTTTSVLWTSGFLDQTYHDSPDLAAVIQELVNSYDYSTARAIQILVDNNGSTSGSEHVGKLSRAAHPLSCT